MNFVEITSNNNWFKKHPEKIAGVEFTTTSIFFPVQVKGTKEDVLRVTGMSKINNISTQSLINVPVIRYKVNGNEIIKTKLTIKPYKNFKNLFIEEKKDKWGNYKAIIKLIKNEKLVYFSEGIYSLDKFQKITQELIDNRIKRVFHEIKIDNTPRYVRLLELEIAKELGINTKHLEKLREQFILERNEKQIKNQKLRIEAEKKIKKQQAAKKENELLKAEKDLLNEKYVDGDLIIDLAKKYNIKIHIRTIGAIRKNDVSFQLQKAEKRNHFNYSFTKKRGKAGYKINDPSFFYELVGLIQNKISDKDWNHLTKNTDKQKRIRIARAKAKAIKIKLLLNEGILRKTY